ncbi:MAG: hypothetical protein QOJ40_1392 [Verrucomicrobiota bacterium]
MISEILESPVGREEPHILLDGAEVNLPPGRRSLSGIRCYLETLAMKRQRVLFSFFVDGKPASPPGPGDSAGPFGIVEGKTIDLDHMPLQLIMAAREQANQAQESVHSVATLVLINEGQVAREFWWNLAVELKRPLMTLCLLPNATFGEDHGGGFWIQLHKWQFEHLGTILKDVDEACWSEDSRVLSHALEHRVLPWLHGLQASLELCYETLLAGSRAAL